MHAVSHDLHNAYIRVTLRFRWATSSSIAGGSWSSNLQGGGGDIIASLSHICTEIIAETIAKIMNNGRTQCILDSMT
jgi:hypothetical protein